MSSVQEIENAIKQLSPEEMKQVRDWLENVLEVSEDYVVGANGVKRGNGAVEIVEEKPSTLKEMLGRDRWMNELAEFRGGIASGKSGPGVEALLAEDRGE